MAQLKDLIVNGASRLIGDTFVNKIQITSISAPTSAGGSTYGLGTSGYILKTNGASVYWAADNNSGGTVTKVTAGTGLSINTTPGGNFTTTGTINHTNSITAQTTQGLYPIKIDAQGHISGYGSVITSLPANDVPAWAKSHSKPTYNWGEISQSGANNIQEGTSDFTDNTELFSSYASNDGFADSNATGQVYRRDAIKLYNYVKTKLAVTNNNINLSRNTETTIATIGGTAIKIKLPASDNTDTKVKQTVKSDNKEYKLLMSAQVSPTSGTAYEAVYDTAITVNPSTDTITATNFSGTATKVGHSITIGDKSFDGQSDVTVNIDDLGLAGSSMEFKGIITQTLTDNGTTSPVTPAGGGSLTPVEGNVVIDATGKEYIWTSGKWHNLGLATDFALSEHVHGNISKSGKIGSTSDYAVYTTTGGLVTAGSLATSDPSASSTTSTTFIDTISQNSKGKITATKKTLPTASTSVAGIIKIGTTANDAAAGNHSHTITANATDGYWDLTGTNGTNAVTYALAPYSSRPSNAGFYTGTTAPNGTTRLNYNGYLYATKLYSGGTAVLTSHQTVINNNINLTWNTETTIATIGSTAIKVKLPVSPGIEIVRLA